MELLSLKFIQGLPVVGIVGGAANPVYYARVLKYVRCQYEKRYLQKQLKLISDAGGKAAKQPFWRLFRSQMPVWADFAVRDKTEKIDIVELNKEIDDLIDEQIKLRQEMKKIISEIEV